MKNSSLSETKPGPGKYALAWLAPCLSFIVSATGLIVLTGWYFDIDLLKRPTHSLIAMNPVTALSFVLLGLSLLLTDTFSEKRKTKHFIGALLAILVIAISLIRILEEFFPSVPGIDGILFPTKLNKSEPEGVINRMALDTALEFILSGTTVLLARLPRRILPDLLTIAVFLLGVAAILGYLYKVPEYYDLLKSLPMSVYTATAFILFAIALFFKWPNRGLAKEVFSPYAGGLMARFLIPFSILAPAILGWFIFATYQKNLFSFEMGLSLLAVSIITLFSSVVIYSTILLNKKDRIEKRSEKKFRGLLESAPDAVIIVSPDGKIQLTNAQAEKLFGYERQEMMGKEVEMLIPQRFHTTHHSYTKSYFSSPKIREKDSGVEFLALKKNGEEFFAEITLSPFETDEGVLAFSSIRDITLRKKEALKFRGLLESAPDSIVIVDRSGCIQMINTQVERMFGYSREELIGQPVELLIPERFRSIHKTHKNGFFKDPHVREMGVGMELFGIRKNKEEFFVEISLSPFETADGMLVSASIRDITARKKTETALRLSEEKFRSIVNNIREYAIFMLDTTGHIATWSNGAEALSNYKAEEILGLHFSLFFPRESVSDAEANKLLDKARDLTKLEKEGWLVRKDGSKFWASILINALYYNNSELSGFVKVVRDMTDWKKTKDILTDFNATLTRQVSEKTEQLNELNAELRRLSSHLDTTREEERKNIAREIHDELGQMLTGLRMDIVWLRKNNGNPGEAIDRRFEKTLELLRDTRNAMRRISSDLHPAVLDDLGLIEALKIQCREFEERTGIRIFFEHHLKNISDTDLDGKIKIGLYRIFQESLTNIIKHAEATEVNAYLKESDNHLILCISDNGVGFDTSSIAGKKTLGLVNMRERIFMMEGKYDILSLPGEGTTILLSIPLPNL